MLTDDAALSADALHVLRVIDAVSFRATAAPTPMILITVGSAVTRIVGLKTRAASNSHLIDAMAPTGRVRCATW